MTRALALSVVASAAMLGAVPADAAPPGLPASPVKLIAEPGSCQPPYYEIGWVGVEGARWRICQRNPAIEPPPI